MLHSRLLKCKQYKWFTCCYLKCRIHQMYSLHSLSLNSIVYSLIKLKQCAEQIHIALGILKLFTMDDTYNVTLFGVKNHIFFTYISHSEFESLKMVVETSVEQITRVFHSSGVKIYIHNIIMYNKNMNSTSITYQCRCVHYC